LPISHPTTKPTVAPPPSGYTLTLVGQLSALRQNSTRAASSAELVAKTINAIYSEWGIERKVNVRYNKGKPYIRLANVDLELLGLIQREY